MKKLLKQKKGQGFTLIELLIVIAIIAIIAAVVYVALDPLTRFQDSRNSRRWSDISAILSAIKVDQVDNRGSYLTAIQNASSGVYMIGTAVSGCAAAAVTDNCGTNPTSDTHCVDLSGLANEGYLAEVPVSPDGTGTWSASLTGYTLEASTSGSITIRACEAEGESGEIKVAR